MANKLKAIYGDSILDEIYSITVIDVGKEDIVFHNYYGAHVKVAIKDAEKIKLIPYEEKSW